LAKWIKVKEHAKGNKEDIEKIMAFYKTSSNFKTLGVH
jgi:hypothetical protein